MHLVWLYTLLSVLLVSLVSVIGIITLVLKKGVLSKLLLFLISFSTGSLLGGVFFHLMPEVVSSLGYTMQVSLSVLAGILLFFSLEKFVSWRHCHVPTSTHHPHPVGIMNLLGDAMHNFMDGMIIAASYLTSTTLGISTTLAVLFHEIPQEIGDFGVLVHAGYTRFKALFYNFLSALTAILGAVAVLVIGNKVLGLTDMLIPFTAGGFIYIASSDLIPELHKETAPAKSIFQLIGIILGMGIMAALLFIG